ncbi:HalOD1 output domain-containing protein [Halomarina pelagica]|uniref:HalOD1 output domain-containing protein n=1 Tax=Halomarina pelagica TaxID=2961599 RepID=UPI0020C475D7|nr:HalOD1 output domain-containing protein [Halomarina sp. BND7]
MVTSDGGTHETSLSTVIVEAIASELRTDPVRLDPPLHDVVDPDALDALFSGPISASGFVAFEYEGYWIEAYSDGRVTVSPTSESAEATTAVSSEN